MKVPDSAFHSYQRLQQYLKRKGASLRLTSLILGALALVFVLGACSPVTNQNPVAAFIATPTIPAQPAAGETVVDLSLDEQENAQFLVVEEIIIALLFIAALVGIAAHKLRVPYTVGLVLIGLALTIRGQIDVDITPNLILALLVPPLIFEAAFHLNLSELRRNLTPIVALAILGVITTTVLVGYWVSYGTGIALPLALVFGSLVAATDPVSVVALFRSMGVPRRLVVLLEGESLFNDGTAIVIFHLMVTAAVTGASKLSLSRSLFDFVRISGGGLAVGLLLGYVILKIIERVDDYLIETTLTSVLAFGAYLIAEMMGVSGVLAVVAAGLINGNIGSRGMSPTTRIVLFNFWEYAAFVANSFVFLLIGIRIDLEVLFHDWQAILWAIIGVLISRAVSVYGLAWLGRDIPRRWQHVLNWGGLRGAISLALALSLPRELGAGREQLQAMAFGVVLFTLLVQGLTMEPLVKWLKLIQRSEIQSEYERRHARAAAGRAGIEHLERQYRQGLLSEHSWQSLAPLLKEYNKTLVSAVKEIISANPAVGAIELETARREYLHAQRSTITDLQKDGVISDDTVSQLVAEVDAALIEPLSTWPELIMNPNPHSKPISRLLTAIIQEQDLENAISSLTKLGISVTRLSSTGGFLGRRNSTLLVGLAAGQEEAIVRALSKSCRKRVEYVATPLEGSPLPFPSPTPITVGGATIFVLDIEHYEEF